MKKLIMTLAAIMFVFHSAWADELVPATSDDLKDFDQQVAKSQEAPRKDGEHRQSGDASKKEAKLKKESLGSLVSAEAKKLKDESMDQRKEMGQWVSNQRRKNSQPDSNEPGGAGRGHGSNDNSPQSEVGRGKDHGKKK
jgi:hypothetical protein